MIELTQTDPHSHRIESQKVYVMLDQITHVSEYETRGRVYGLVHLVNGKQIIVNESVDTISARIRDHAAAQHPEAAAPQRRRRDAALYWPETGL